MKPPFEPLGRFGVYYFYRCPDGRIIGLRATQHRAVRLMDLADLGFWRANFPHGKISINWDHAASETMLQCRSAGIYSPKGNELVPGKGWSGEYQVIAPEYV